MPSIEHSVFNLEKRVPLTIARGTHSHSRILWLRWKEESIEGWGDADRRGQVANLSLFASLRRPKQSRGCSRILRFARICPKEPFSPA
ncbi:MAG: hypothetical protein HY736_20770 [Verrucomicrobia bacterium]|nr:hypothetical protein [Verrucomicrobiota bacterium]